MSSLSFTRLLSIPTRSHPWCTVHLQDSTHWVPGSEPQGISKLSILVFFTGTSEAVHTPRDRPRILYNIPRMLWHNSLLHNLRVALNPPLLHFARLMRGAQFRRGKCTQAGPGIVRTLLKAQLHPECIRACRVWAEWVCCGKTFTAVTTHVVSSPQDQLQGEPVFPARQEAALTAPCVNHQATFPFSRHIWEGKHTEKEPFFKKRRRIRQTYLDCITMPGAWGKKSHKVDRKELHLLISTRSMCHQRSEGGGWGAENKPCACSWFYLVLSKILAMVSNLLVYSAKSTKNQPAWCSG